MSKILQQQIGTASAGKHPPTPFENLAILRQYLNGHTWEYYEAIQAIGRLEAQIEKLMKVAGYVDGDS